MSDDPDVMDKGWDARPTYREKPPDGDDAVTVSVSTASGEWLVNTNDAVVVPMSMLEVVEALRSQRLTERSLVWRAGMQEWAPLEKVPQLRLAARLPSVPPPPSSAPARSGHRPVPPPKPARFAATVTETPLPAPSAARGPVPAPPRSASVARALPSRMATLPFGVTTPLAGSSRPLHGVPARRPALPPPSAEDAEVLAVYERPTATISFELAAEEQLETLAPTTTDSAPKRPPLPPPRKADLSLVATPDFRQAPHFSRRLIFLSSIGSAAVASLLTLWLSRGAAPPPRAASTAPVQTLAPLAEPVSPPSVAAPPAAPEPVATAETPSPSASSKPKAKRKARVWRPPPAAALPTAAEQADNAAPSANPNPYDVRLDEDDAASAQPPSAKHGSGLEPESSAREETATTSPTSPGF